MSKKPGQTTRATPDETDIALIETAEAMLADHFFDPEAEDQYKALHSLARSGQQKATLLREETVEVLEQDCTLRLEGLRTWTTMRVTIEHPDFGASIEGTWSFDHQELRHPRVADRYGSTSMIEAGLDEISDVLANGLSDEELQELMDFAADEADAGPLIGDDPREPPPATATDRARVKAIAKRIARSGSLDLPPEDHTWIEEMPQTLPVITELLMDLAKDFSESNPLLDAYLLMLGMQLEYVRYRQDRGWKWAGAMLQDFQKAMLSFGQQHNNPEVFMAMGRVLQQARVPVSESMREALAEAGVGQEDPGPPEQLEGMLEAVMTQLAEIVNSPFDVIGAMNDTGAIFPAHMRGFIIHKMSQSAHAVIRESVALALLDQDASVRSAAVAALRQGASPGTMSPATLRRAIAVRNWLPEAERPALDDMVRTARQAGIEIGSWPSATSEPEYHVSMIDGSGAQSILMLSKAGSKAAFGALLLREGEGVIDAWEDPELSRGKAAKLLREAQQSAPTTRVSRGAVDQMVQHALGTSADRGAVPPEMLLRIAERTGATEWRARRHDIAAEVARVLAGAGQADRGEAAMRQVAAWLAEAPTLRTWFEEGPDVHAKLSKLPRTNKPALIGTTLAEVLDPRRDVWAERFALMALWCEASGDTQYWRRAAPMAAVADALLSGQPLAEIPPMRTIAAHTVTNELLTPW